MPLRQQDQEGKGWAQGRGVRMPTELGLDGGVCLHSGWGRHPDHMEGLRMFVPPEQSGRGGPGWYT